MHPSAFLPTVDWSNPITRKLVHVTAASALSAKDPVSGNLPTLTNFARNQPALTGGFGDLGLAWGSTGAAGFLDYGTGADSQDVALGPATWVFWAQWTGGSQGLAERNDGNTVNQGWAISLKDDGTGKPEMAIVIEQSSTNYKGSWTDSTITTTNRPRTHMWAVTWDGNLSTVNGLLGYADARRLNVTNAATGAGTQGSDAGQSLHIGKTSFASQDVVAASFTGFYEMALIFKRQLSQDEITSLYLDRYQVLAPFPSRTWMSITTAMPVTCNWSCQFSDVPGRRR